MADHKIIEHEDWQTLPYLTFVEQLYRQSGLGLLPPVDQVRGLLVAEVHQGRWVVGCRTAGCGAAVCISSQVPFFMCPMCGNVSNGSQWYAVTFPLEKQEIEAVLLRRPALRPFDAENRNWLAGQTVADLEAENKANGID